MQQRSDEWHEARCGSFTASRAKDLMARGKSGPSASRANLISTLALERLTERCEKTFKNSAMDAGAEKEPLARQAYERRTGYQVVEVAYVEHPEIPFLGCSPDGLIGRDGLAEFKCPFAMAKHFEYLTKSSHARIYNWQVQHQMLVTGRAWTDVVSFDPRYPEGLQLAIKRVDRNEDAIAQLTEEIAKAEIEIADMLNKLEQIRRAA